MVKHGIGVGNIFTMHPTFHSVGRSPGQSPLVRWTEIFSQGPSCPVPSSTALHHDDSRNSLLRGWLLLSLPSGILAEGEGLEPPCGEPRQFSGLGQYQFCYNPPVIYRCDLLPRFSPDPCSASPVSWSGRRLAAFGSAGKSHRFEPACAGTWCPHWDSNPGTRSESPIS